MSDCFRLNQSLVDVVWPPGLEELNLQGFFNQPIEGSAFPKTLRELSFVRDFAYSLWGPDLPEGLTRLYFSESCLVSHLRVLNWPRSLRSLHVGYSPSGCQEALARWLSYRL